MPTTTALPITSTVTPLALVPAKVRVRLTESTDFFREKGPVMPSDAGRLTGELAELATQALVHGQQELALPLLAALAACEHAAARRAA
jgi:hypothetical protein